jgi:predicted transcriptional regulator
MPLIVAQPLAPEKDMLSLRLDQELHHQLKAYAEFIASSKDYVISQALHRVFRHDKEFAAWLAARPDRQLETVRQHPAAEVVETTGPVERVSKRPVPALKRARAQEERS